MNKKLIKYLLVIFIFILAIVFINLKNNIFKQGWVFDKIVDKTIYFSSGRQFNIDLYDMKYVGQLQTKNKSPYLILSGRDCYECDENISIYIYSPYSGLIKGKWVVNRYTYPGKEHDYEDNKILFESRMFYGSCLKGRGDSIVWIRKEHNDKENFENSTYILEVANDDFKETILKNDSLLDEVIKNCNELPGIDYFPEP